MCLKNGYLTLSDNTELPMLEGEKHTDKPETLYVAIDGFSRELYAAILPDGTQYSSTSFLMQVLEEGSRRISLHNWNMVYW